METKTNLTTEEKAHKQVIDNKDKLLRVKLEEMNKKRVVSKAIKNKYVYPSDLQELKSTDKQKRTYRKNIQKTILSFLESENITINDKKEFNEYLKIFVKNFTSLDSANIEDIYSFHNELEKNKANTVLNKFKSVK